MLSKERLLHPATIIAVIALLVALSGAGYAATTIGTSQLKNNAVTTPKIKNAAVNTAKLKNNAVNSSKLASGAVKAADLANGAVTGAKLANDAVTAAKIAGGAVGTNALAAGAVDSGKLGNGSVSGEKIGPNAVTGPKIAGGTITAANIAPGQVVTGKGTSWRRLRLVPTAAVDTPVLTVPGVGAAARHVHRRRSRPTTISFLNASGGGPGRRLGRREVGGAHRPGRELGQPAASRSTGRVHRGISSTGALGLDYQVSFVKAGSPRRC